MLFLSTCSFETLTSVTFENAAEFDRNAATLCVIKDAKSTRRGGPAGQVLTCVSFAILERFLIAVLLRPCSHSCWLFSSRYEAALWTSDWRTRPTHTEHSEIIPGFLRSRHKDELMRSSEALSRKPITEEPTVTIKRQVWRCPGTLWSQSSVLTVSVLRKFRTATSFIHWFHWLKHSCTEVAVVQTALRLNLSEL